jgi:hypothetical protein
MDDPMPALRREIGEGAGKERIVSTSLLVRVADALARITDERDAALMRIRHLEDQQKGWVAYVNKTLAELKKAGAR